MSPRGAGWSDDNQDTLDDLLHEDERLLWARQHRCFHCYVWAFDKREQMFMIVCAHGCGSIKHKWESCDAEGDMRRVKMTQEAFKLAHARGCPRDSSRRAVSYR